MSSGSQPEEVETECRICHTKSTAGLVQPCHCKGSLGHVHIACLEKWLRVSSNISCELCAYTFPVVKVRRYSLLQSVRVWVHKDRARITRGSLILLLLVVNPAAASWLWALWLSQIPTVFFKRDERDNTNDILIVGEEEEEISVTKWIIVFTILTIMVVVSLLSLYFDVYRNILRRLYRAWRRVRNKTVVRIAFEPENGRGRSEEENKENGCSNIAAEKENIDVKDKECLQEIKISSSNKENED